MTWSETLAARLPLLGHRNWIVVADSAFPAQCSEGMEIVWSGEELLPVAFETLNQLRAARHVRPRIMVDAELDALDDMLCPGIENFRGDLDRLVSSFGGRQALAHDEILKQMAKLGQTYSILMIKTTMTMPYTSLFIDLQCGYWGDSAESQLRAKMAAPRH
jgi:D-ribose pyranose/furanose isomerase RbsD